MKKKIFTLILIAFFLLSLTGCGNKNEENANQTDNETNQNEITEVGNLNLELHDVSSFQEGFATIIVNGKYGFINQKGEIVIEPKYDGAYDFNEGLAEVGLEDLTRPMSKPNTYYNNHGFIDKNGNIVVDIKYENVLGFNDGLAIVKEGIKAAIIDKTGKELTDFKYSYIYSALLGNGLIWVDASDIGGESGKYSIIDANNNYEPITSDVFDGTTGCSSGFCAVSKNKKYGVIDYKGQLITDYLYDSITIYSKDLFIVRQDEKYGVIDSKGNIVVDIKYDDFNMSSTLSDGSVLIPFKSGNKWSYFNAEGKEVISLEENVSTYGFYDDLARVRKDKKYGYIDKEGKLVIDYQYEKAQDFSEGLALVGKDEQSFEFINHSGTTIIAGKLVD